MPAPTYDAAIDWIARHEPHADHNPLMEAGDRALDVATVQTYTTVAMVSDLFARHENEVALAVVRRHAVLNCPPIQTVAGVRRANRKENRA